jgi:hypothetical protein
MNNEDTPAHTQEHQSESEKIAVKLGIHPAKCSLIIEVLRKNIDSRGNYIPEVSDSTIAKAYDMREVDVKTIRWAIFGDSDFERKRTRHVNILEQPETNRELLLRMFDETDLVLKDLADKIHVLANFMAAHQQPLKYTGKPRGEEVISDIVPLRELNKNLMQFYSSLKKCAPVLRDLKIAISRIGAAEGLPIRVPGSFEDW